MTAGADHYFEPDFIAEGDEPCDLLVPLVCTVGLSGQNGSARYGLKRQQHLSQALFAASWLWHRRGNEAAFTCKC